MKRRWSVLFWCSLAALIGVSWLAARFGMSLTSMMSIGLIGMICACAIAFFAMVRAIPAKWPAALVLVGAAPATIDMGRLLPHMTLIVRYFGGAGVLLVTGTLATTLSALVILAAKPPPPPEPPPVAPARVVD